MRKIIIIHSQHNLNSIKLILLDTVTGNIILVINFEDQDESWIPAFSRANKPSYQQ